MVSYLLWFHFLSFIFLVLGIAFLIYFSSFLAKHIDIPSIKNPGIRIEFSLKNIYNQWFFPLAILLFYFSIYGIAYGLIDYDRVDGRLFHLHNIIILALFLLLFSIYLLFERRLSELYFRITRFHIFFSSITTILLSVVYFFDYATLQTIFLVNTLILLGSIFFIEYRDKYITEIERRQNFLLFLFLLFSSVIVFGYNIFAFDKIYWLLFVMSGMSIFTFDSISKFAIFEPYILISKYFWLILSFLTVLALGYYNFYYFSFTLGLLIVFILFHIRVHFRFGNYLSFGFALASLFFIYTRSFIDMLQGWFFSSIMFLYFLPILMISATFFWKKEYEYDYVFVHYTSIALSILLSLYYTFWIGWIDVLHISIMLFILSIIFFFSYIRLKQ